MSVHEVVMQWEGSPESAAAYVAEHIGEFLHGAVFTGEQLRQMLLACLLVRDFAEQASAQLLYALRASGVQAFAPGIDPAEPERMVPVPPGQTHIH